MDVTAKGVPRSAAVQDRRAGTKLWRVKYYHDVKAKSFADDS